MGFVVVICFVATCDDLFLSHKYVVVVRMVVISAASASVFLLIFCKLFDLIHRRSIILKR